MRLDAVLCLAAAAVLSGCASPGDDVLEVTFDPCRPAVVVAEGATPEQLASLDDAIAMWRGVEGVQLTREASPGAPVIAIVFEAAARNFHGVYEDEIGVIYINSTIVDPAQRSITIAHELGHAFGLWHVAVAERASVMNPNNLEITPTNEDEASIRALWSGCGQAADLELAP